MTWAKAVKDYPNFCDEYLREEVNMITLRLLLAICCVFVLIVGEQNAQEIKKPTIVGRWEATNQTVEIFEDGKIIINNKVKKEISEERMR